MGNKIRNIDATAQRIQEADSQTMWDDYVVDCVPGHHMIVYYNDFLSYVSDEWTVTEVGACSQTILDERGGVLRFTPPATATNGTEMQLGGSLDSETVGEAFAPAVGKMLYFETRVRSSDADQCPFFVGLHVQDTTVVASKGTDYLGFSVADEAATIAAVSANTSVVSTEANVGTVVDATWVKLGFKVTGSSLVEFYVNDALVGQITTNIPTALMKLSIGALTGADVANTFDIDYVKVAQSR